MFGFCLILFVLQFIPALCFKCNQRNTEFCTCNDHTGSFVAINCDFDGATISLFGNKSRIRLQCNNGMSMNNWIMIPFKEDLSQVTEIELNYCYPALLISYYDFFKDKNITKVLELSIHTTHIHQRDSFDNLSSLKVLKYFGNETFLPQNMFDPLVNLEQLELNDVELNISASTFKYNKKLTKLLLNGEYIQLTMTPFAHLGQLKELTFAHMQMLQLELRLFKGLIKLEMLHFWECNFSEISPDMFESLINLKLLVIKGGNTMFFYEQQFKTSKQLEHVQIRDVKLNDSYVSSQFLAHQKMLKYVSLANCSIRALAPDSFFNSSSIQTVDLHKNKIQHLPLAIFNSLVLLTRIDLSMNYLEGIETALFASNDLLEHINLSSNNIVYIKSSTFKKMQKLTSVNLSRNKMITLYQNTFAKNLFVKYMDVSYNRLHYMNETRTFENLVYLEWLNVSHNEIVTFRKDKWNLQTRNLRYIDLSYNNITSVSYSDLRLNSKKVRINLDHNNIGVISFENYIKELGEEVATNNYAEDNRYVSIAQNPFKCECDLLDLLVYMNGDLDPRAEAIVNLNLTNAKCAEPKHLEGRKLASLKKEELYCAVKNLECPPLCACYYHPSDRSLIFDCSKRNGTSIPNFKRVQSSASFIDIRLENMGLNYLGPYFPNNTDKVFLRDNNLDEMELEKLPNSVTVLDIRNNNVSRLDPESKLLRGEIELKELWISGNPIKCDCFNDMIIIYLQINHNITKDYMSVRCTNGTLVNAIDVSVICNDKHPHALYAFLLSIIILMIALCHTKGYWTKRKRATPMIAVFKTENDYSHME